MRLKKERESRERKFVKDGKNASCNEMGNVIVGEGELVKRDVCQDRLL